MSNDISFKGRTHSDAGWVSELCDPFSIRMVARRGNVAMAESVAPLVHSSGFGSRWKCDRLFQVYVSLACALP